MKHDEIIAKFGGVRSCAFALGHNNPTTVQAWKSTGRIPKWRWHEVLAAARKKRLGLKETDFEVTAK